MSALAASLIADTRIHLSNCLPIDVTVRFNTTRLNVQFGGEYDPGSISMVSIFNCYRSDVSATNGAKRGRVNGDQGDFKAFATV